jgi:hypothetical protein
MNIGRFTSIRPAIICAYIILFLVQLSYLQFQFQDLVCNYHLQEPYETLLVTEEHY